MTKQLLLGVAALCLVLGACGGDEETPETRECTTAEDCAEGQICDTDGTCKDDTTPIPCDGACTGATPICDDASNTCKTCTETEGCSGAAAICDTAANAGAGACVACLGTSDCTAPSVCDPVSHTCVGCTETEGCSGDAPICADGTCVACTADEGCGTDEICDTAVTGGACVTCTATAGCDAGEVCDLSVGGGACVTCTAEVGCASPTAVCDTSVPGGVCVECTTDDDCDGTEICDESRHECVVCNDANEGCSNPWPYCDVAAAEGRGECVGCLLDDHCPGTDYPVCHPERQSCVVCAGHDDCTDPAAPYCKESPFGFACVGCIDSTQCGGDTPVCDPAANGGVGACTVCSPTEGCGGGLFCNVDVPGGECVTCKATRGCTGGLVCDTTVPGGECVTCLPDGSGCTGDLLCDTTVAGGACVTCLPDGAGCAANESCVEGACALTASLQIQAVRDAAEDVTLALPIEGAYVTYVRPDTGDPDGFFVQAEATGPAILVMVNPASLTPPPVVGDQVSFTVTMKDVYGQAEEITALENWAVTSSGNDVAAFIQDLSGASDLLTGIEAYESELATLSGTIAGTFGGSGSGMVAAPFTSAGVTTVDPNLLVRMPTALRDSLDLTQGCTFTVVAAPVWRYNDRTQMTVYYPSDFTGIGCPAPTWVSAFPPAADAVSVAFDRVLDAASVLANGSQFTFDNGLVATAATVAGKTVTLTTTEQTPGTTYTLTVAATVLGLHGAPVVAPATPVTFDGFTPLPPPTLVINEVEYDNVGTDSSEFVEIKNVGAAPVTLDNLSLVLVNGSNGDSYANVALSGTLPAGGYAVVCPSSMLASLPVGTLGFALPGATDQIQNGSPDAVVLFNNVNNTIIDTLAYEGAMNWDNGPLGVVALVSGNRTMVQENSTAASTLCRMPDGSDTGDDATDWVSCAGVSPGAPNAL